MCAESAFVVTNLNAAEFEMQPLGEEDSVALLNKCSSRVRPTAASLQAIQLLWHERPVFSVQ